MNTLPFEKKVKIISALVAGCSERATAGMCDVNRETVMCLGLRMGLGCERLHNDLVCDVQVPVLEVDELWSFVGKKQRRLRPHRRI